MSIVADCADGADGHGDVFGPRVNSDHPGSSSAFTAEGNLDAQRPKERLRTTQSAGECPGVLRPSWGPAREAGIRQIGAGTQEVGSISPVHVLQFAIICRIRAASGSTS